MTLASRGVGNSNISWGRIKQAIYQEAKKIDKAQKVESILIRLQSLEKICGEFTSSRKVLVKIGKILLEDNPQILVPCCPDYGYRDGKYTFHELNGGVSLLAQKHIQFLQKIVEIIPEIVPIFIFADLEAEDDAIRQAVRQTKEEFLELVNQSVIATRQEIKSLGWRVELMTTIIPDLLQRERVKREWICLQERFRSRIQNETLARVEMYQKLNAQLTWEQKVDRTLRTAAQYLALGDFAASESKMICNHTTTSINWYLKTDVAVLHNPTSIY